jgi:hypothetical protein
MHMTNIRSSTIIDEVYKLSVASPGIALAYFYFDFNGNARRTVESLVRSIISQFFAQMVETNSPLDDLFSRSEEGARQVPYTSLFATILPTVRGFKKTYVIVDALDECLECEELLQTLKTIHWWAENSIHILVTSRQTSEIREVLGGVTSDNLCVHDSSIDQDVNLYLTACLTNDWKLARLPADVRADIQKTLNDKSDGM